MVSAERRVSTAASRTMAAMSLGFIVMITPWTIQEVVAACTGSKAPPFMDFIVTWLSLSNSFWNPFLYWLLNANFRRVCKEVLLSKVLCRSPSTEELHEHHCCSLHPEVPPPPQKSADECSEKHWAEILERTVSSSSLLALQRVYGSRQACCNPHDITLFPTYGQITEI